MEGTATTLRLRDLSAAADGIGTLLRCAPEWLPEEEALELAIEMARRLRAVANMLEQFAERNRELIALHHEDRIDEVVDVELSGLRRCLR